MLRRVRMRSSRCSSVPVPPNRRSNTTRGLISMGSGAVGTGPCDRVHVRAAVSDIARADEAREVLRRELERRERRVLTDGLRDDLIDGCFVPDVHAFGLLGRNARQPHRRRGGVPARRRILRAIQSADDAQMIAKGLERLENGGKSKPVPSPPASTDRGSCRAARRPRRSGARDSRPSGPWPSAPVPSPRAAAAPW